MVRGDINSSTTVVVRSIYLTRDDAGCNRVSAVVGGHVLWFESADTDLSFSAEGFASILLVPAMSQGLNLVFKTRCVMSGLIIPEYLLRHSRNGGVGRQSR
jgi:hypothetical protein